MINLGYISITSTASGRIFNLAGSRSNRNGSSANEAVFKTQVATSTFVDADVNLSDPLWCPIAQQKLQGQHHRPCSWRASCADAVHCKALLSPAFTDDDALTASADLIAVAATHGSPLERWQQLISCMIKKKAGNCQLNKLRTMHLFEAD